MQAMKHASEEIDPDFQTEGRDITRSPKQGVSVALQKGLMFSKNV